MKAVLTALMVFLAATLPASDRLELSNGDVITGTINRLDRQTVVIETEYGTLEIDRSRVVRGFLGTELADPAVTSPTAPRSPDVSPSGSPESSDQATTNSTSARAAGSDVEPPELQDGLLMHLPLDGSVADSTGRYSPANNGMRFVSGASGGANSALRSDGGGTYLSVASDDRLNELNQLTVSFWVRADDAVPTQYLVSKWVRADGEMAEGKFTIQTSRRSITVYLVDHSGRYYWVAAPDALVDGEWQHVAVTFAGGRAVIFVNGEQAAARRFAFDQLYEDDSPLLIMTAEATHEDPYGYYNARGSIDDLRLYERALTAEEVALLAGIGQAPPQ